jgi:chromosome segregation ATPase
MTTDRLDRIEAILASLAESQAAAEQRSQEFQAAAEQRSQEFQALAEQRYRESDQRLSRIEALQALTQQQIDSTQQQINSTQQQIDSNARSISAWEKRFTEIEAETQEATSSTRADLSARIDSQSEQIGVLRRQADDDWTRFDQRHEEHAQRFNTLLEEVRADRQQMDRFMQSSTENIQTLFAEISRIWRRLGG